MTGWLIGGGIFLLWVLYAAEQEAQEQEADAQVRPYQGEDS